MYSACLNDCFVMFSNYVLLCALLFHNVYISVTNNPNYSYDSMNLV